MNDAIFQYLASYCKAELAHPYALLLKGPWGCGKTHFINACMDKLSGEQNFLYVSVFGTTSISQLQLAMLQSHLENEIGSDPNGSTSSIKKKAKQFLASHPQLVNILHGINFNQFGLSIDVASLDLARVILAKKDIVLVIDDLERTKVPVIELFGYLNNFIEQNKMKVIILADEERLLASNWAADSSFAGEYGLMKEKLIGKSLDVLYVVKDSWTVRGLI